MNMDNSSFDQTVFKPDFQLDGSHLVEASAGTGKTYNIQNIYARLIMEKGCKVPEIEVMTYTEAATKELHERLHTVLKDLQCRFCDPPQSCPGRDEAESSQRNLRADRLIGCVTPQKRAEARLNVELALLDFDNAAISTIHGFCQRILTRYAFDTSINLAAEIEDNKSAELNLLAEDWWRRRPADAPSDISLSTLKNYVGKLAGKSGYILQKSDDEAANYLLDTATQLVEVYEKARKERDKLSFDDLLRAVREALKADKIAGGVLISRLRQNIKAALIDEFQDTDPIQYEIFELLFLDGNPNPLFFVGDPKQAIYSFRGGDIYTYLKAKGREGQMFYSLNVNHRSTGRMMKAVNEMFMDELPEKDDAPHCTFGDPQIGYAEPVRVEAEPHVKGGLLMQPLRILELPPAPPLKNKASDSKKKMEQILALIENQVLTLLAEKDADGKNLFSPQDIAILTNSNTRNAEIRQKLLARRIPCTVRKSGNVFASSVAAELRIFLMAVQHPDDRDAVRAAMTTVFGGIPFDRLPPPEQPEALTAAIEKFSALNKLWSSDGFAALTAGIDADGCRERIARHTDGERLLADFEQIVELLFAAVKQLGNSAERLIVWLTDRINRCSGGAADDEDETDAEEYARELESDRNAVKIMTIHASKGLQFPVVLLPDCWRVTDIRVFMPAEYHNGEKLVFSLDEADKPRTKEELKSEKIRLLYVALTRAVERTVIFTPPVNSMDQEEPLTHLLHNLQRRCGDDPSYEIFSADQIHFDGNYIPQETMQELLPARIPPVFSAMPTKGSYTSLSPSLLEFADDEEGKDQDQGETPVFGRQYDPLTAHPIFSICSGAAIGICWHSILEKLSFDADDREIARLTAKELGDSGFLQQDKTYEHTVKMIRKVLEHPISAPSGERFSLAQVRKEQRLSEQEFNFATANAQRTTLKFKEILLRHWGADAKKAEFLRAVRNWDKPVPCGFMTGFIDLIFQYGDCFYIIDWKSNALNGNLDNFNAAGIRREMALHGYFFQYLLYAVVLHFHLKQLLKENYSWEKNFGGIRYYFLRGIAADGEAPVYADRPSAELLEDLGAALGLEAQK